MRAMTIYKYTFQDYYLTIFFIHFQFCLDSPNVETPSVKQILKKASKLPSNPEEVEDLRGGSAMNTLIAFTFNELERITDNFKPNYFLGEGGFGCVYRGFVTEDLRPGIQPLQVAVKVHDAKNSFQGHREWLVQYLFTR